MREKLLHKGYDIDKTLIIIEETKALL